MKRLKLPELSDVCMYKCECDGKQERELWTFKTSTISTHAASASAGLAAGSDS